jgi:hypothetical protein
MKPEEHKEYRDRIALALSAHESNRLRCYGVEGFMLGQGVKEARQPTSDELINLRSTFDALMCVEAEYEAAKFKDMVSSHKAK